MSQFIKSSAEKALIREFHRGSSSSFQQIASGSPEVAASAKGSCSGFTEAELAAAEWARALDEVRENYARTTNHEVRNGRNRKPHSGSAPRKQNLEQSHVPGNEHKQHEKQARKLAKQMKKEESRRERKETKNTEKKPKKDKKEKANKHDRHPHEKLSNKKDKKLKKDKKTKKHGTTSLAKSGTGDAIDSLIEAARAQAIGAGTDGDEVVHVDLQSSSLVAPRDPFNPLEKAHDVKAYEELSNEQRPKRNVDQVHERPWDHEPFLLRSPSPCRLRTEGPMWNTRKQAWKSRAGGVYLPPVAPPRDQSPSPSPARYAFPEELLNRRRNTNRRSPSYNPENRKGSRSSSSSSTTSSSSAERRRQRSRAERNRVRERVRRRSASSSTLSSGEKTTRCI